MSVVSGVRTRVTESSITPVLVLFVGALGIRSLQVGLLPLADHRITVMMVRRFGTIELLWQIPRVQPHFPLYYILLDVWSDIFPIHAATYLSGLAGGLTPVVTYAFAKERLSDWRAFLAGTLVLFSPLLAIQSRWLRMYALLTLFVLLSWWTAYRYLQSEGRAATYGLCAVITVGLHPFGIAVVLSQLAWLTLEQYKTAWKPYFRGILGTLSVLSVGPVLYLLARIADVQGTGTIDGTHMHIQYADVPVQRALVLPLTTLIGTIHHPVFLVAALAVTGSYAYLCYRSQVWSNRMGRLTLCWILGALTVLYMGHMIRPVIMLKYVGWLAPGVAILIAIVTPRNHYGDILLGCIFGIALTNFLFGYLIKLNNSMVAIWESGVLESGAV